MENYYSEKKKKIIDFAIGFGGSILIASILILWDIDEILITMSLLVLAQIVVLILSFVKYRHFIAYGILASWLIPVIIVLLLFGACTFGSFN